MRIATTVIFAAAFALVSGSSSSTSSSSDVTKYAESLDFSVDYMIARPPSEDEYISNQLVHAASTGNIAGIDAIVNTHGRRAVANKVFEAVNAAQVENKLAAMKHLLDLFDAEYRDGKCIMLPYVVVSAVTMGKVPMLAMLLDWFERNGGISGEVIVQSVREAMLRGRTEAMQYLFARFGADVRIVMAVKSALSWMGSMDTANDAAVIVLQHANKDFGTYVNWLESGLRDAIALGKASILVLILDHLGGHRNDLIRIVNSCLHGSYSGMSPVVLDVLLSRFGAEALERGIRCEIYDAAKQRQMNVLKMYVDRVLVSHPDIATLAVRAAMRKAERRGFDDVINLIAPYSH